MKDETKPERRPRKRWKRIVKWSAGVIFLALVLVTFIAYWMSTNDCYRSSAALNIPIKAVVHCEYGPPDVLKLEDVEKPVPNDNQLLVKVRAASVNPLDLTIRGPWLIRPLIGLRKPKDTRLGVDYCRNGRGSWQQRHELQTRRRSFRRENRLHRGVHLRSGRSRSRPKTQQHDVRAGSGRSSRRAYCAPRPSR